MSLMTEQISSGWVPDKVPNSRTKKVQISVPDTLIERETFALARYFNVPADNLGRKFIKLGLLVNNIEQNPNSEIVVRDSMGRRDPIRLVTQEYQPNALARMEENKNQKRKLIFSMPVEL